MRSSIASGQAPTPACARPRKAGARPRRARPSPGAGVLFAGLLVLLPVLFPGTPALAQAVPPLALPALPAASVPAPAMSDPRAADTAYRQAQRLVDEGRPDDALAAIETALQASPSDARLRFLKGVILGGQGKDAEAIEVFQGLARQFPELPEPHNNLAALHAARGELDQARAALDDAIRALPSYALAHENLGDLHLRLAIRAWQRAAELEPGNAAPASKLKLARELARRIAGEAQGAAALPGAR